MKKTIVASIILIIAIVCPLAASGTIGLGGGYRVLLDSNGNLASQGFCLTITGTNPLNPTNLFGIEYSAARPFMFNRLADSEIWSFGTGLYVRLSPIEKLDISIHAGLSYETIRKMNMTSTQIGPSVAAAIEYKAIDGFKASAVLGYSTPAVRMYGTTVRRAWFINHTIMCSLYASYVY